MNKSIFFDTGSIILLIMIMISIFFIYRMYQSPVTGKNVLIGVYLYIFVALLTIAYVGRIVASMDIDFQANSWKYILAFFVIACGGISLMTNSNFYLNHIGFLLLLLALSLTVGISFKYSNNIFQAVIITCIILAILTIFTFYSSEETMIKMSSWLPNLTSILLCLICAQFIYIFFFSYNRAFGKILSISIIALFIFFVLSDTSRIILEARMSQCRTQSCINYPLKSSSLVLDYINIFINFLNFNR